MNAPAVAQDDDGRVVPTPVPTPHVQVLDGWRGVSIVLVLIAHLVPLGHIANDSIGIAGMALFFNLSGYLITSFLLKDGATLPDFLLRRFFRIVPLSWLYLAIVFAFQSESLRSQVAHFLFYANVPPKSIRFATDHLWSLCVEVQFYVGIALLFALLKRRGLLLLPVLALVFTGLRVADGAYASSVTWYRVDEILAGCALALVLNGKPGRWSGKVIASMRAAPQWALCIVLLACSVFGLGHVEWLAYFRPYVGAFLIGSTLGASDTRLANLLKHRALAYLASISFALYVLHIGLTQTWLGSGGFVAKYAKRPLLLAVLFTLAHLSTYRYERPLIAFGKRLSARLARRSRSTDPQTRPLADRPGS